MKTETNVWLLPTKDTNSPLVIDDASKKLFPCTPGEAAWGNQHLYITLPQSNLEISKIKEGDWELNIGTTAIYKCLGTTKNNSKHLTNWQKETKVEKIIATTDSSLELPSIPSSFISYYIEKYNKGVGFNATVREEVILRLSGSHKRVIKIQF